MIIGVFRSIVVCVKKSIIFFQNPFEKVSSEYVSLSLLMMKHDGPFVMVMIMGEYWVIAKKNNIIKR